MFRYSKQHRIEQFLIAVLWIKSVFPCVINIQCYFFLTVVRIFTYILSAIGRYWRLWTNRWQSYLCCDQESLADIEDNETIRRSEGYFEDHGFAEFSRVKFISSLVISTKIAYAFSHWPRRDFLTFGTKVGIDLRVI